MRRLSIQSPWRALKSWGKWLQARFGFANLITSHANFCVLYLTSSGCKEREEKNILIRYIYPTIQTRDHAIMTKAVPWHGPRWHLFGISSTFMVHVRGVKPKINGKEQIRRQIVGTWVQVIHKGREGKGRDLGTSSKGCFLWGLKSQVPWGWSVQFEPLRAWKLGLAVAHRGPKSQIPSMT